MRLMCECMCVVGVLVTVSSTEQVSSPDKCPP